MHCWQHHRGASLCLVVIIVWVVPWLYAAVTTTSVAILTFGLGATLIATFDTGIQPSLKIDPFGNWQRSDR